MEFSNHTKEKLFLFAKYAKRSALEALAATLLFSLIYYAGSKIEFIRANAVDPAFNYINLLYFSSTASSDKNHTPISVFEIDREYLKTEGLLDQYNATNYGYLFPREKIAEFIEKIDRLPHDKQPLVLFIDYDMSYGALPGGKLSKCDHTLLNALAEPRKYKILIPKTDRSNIIEAYEKNATTDIEKIIKEKIVQKMILFVDVNFLSSNDKVMRYNPMKKYPDSNTTYYNVALAIWQLIKNGDINTSEIEMHYDHKTFLKDKNVNEGAAIVKSNILVKDKIEINDALSEYNSTWKGLQYFSASHDFNSSGFTNKTIVMLGGVYQGQDAKKLGTGDEIPGVELHAQAVKTVLFLDGALKKISPFDGFLIIFSTYFFTTLIIHYLFAFISFGARFFIGLFILSFTFFTISSYLVVVYNTWFNWFIPILFFYLDELVHFLKGGINFLKKYRIRQFKNGAQ